ncbi:E3 ubiquitin-protein ligase ZNF598 isoform X2 [Cimex lectularius]|uniref:RING-type E3 ubiquitin transferase n=1 Tax=Cimex lectularius TaxID=79782 RepID=A0A8I6RD43_CIMLE|nr:E3 ubiquitin-protein ligase ZNF598 isoform X2 [Cimex lectularius]
MDKRKQSSAKEENGENACVICFKKVDIYSLGQCDHPVCFECSTRMRVLCRQNECPICRQDLPKVVFTCTIKPFEQIQQNNCQFDDKYKITFQSKEIKTAFEDLLKHECPECGKIWANFNELRDHVRRVHQLTYCDLCVDNLKILTSERRCYTRKELAEHRRHGDPNDRSHRGHPLCKFCETRYMDNDELYRHVRRDHLYCHFCDADGIHQYYKTYDSLREHFRAEHFLCEEGECYLEKFTSVFRTEIDLKAHKANEHGKALGKAGIKQARKIDIEFSLSSRPRAYVRRTNYRGEGGHSSTHQEEEEVEIQPTPTPQRQPNTNCQQEFPTLGGSPAAPPLSHKVNHPRFTTTLTASKANTNEHTYNYHFPALDLGSGSPGPSSAPQTGQTKSQESTWTTTNKKEGKKKDVSKSHVVSLPHNAYNAKPANKNPPNLDDFPALAPKKKQPEKTLTKSIASNTAPSSDSDHPQPSKSKKKKSKSKTQGSTNVAGTNVKKKQAACVLEKNTPGEPETLTKTSNKENECEPKENIEEMEKSDQQKHAKPKSNAEMAKKSGKEKLDEAFPALAGTETSKAPPGFEVNWAPKRPPPGLAPPSQQVVAPPPGFTAMNGASFPPLGGDNLGLGEYIPPLNFEKRNNALVDKVANALGSDSWVQFKDISMAYRSGIVSPDDYYKHCRLSMTEKIFAQLFPELLALLPDINKQEQLWTLYSMDNEADKSKLKKCAVCRQVVRSGDFSEHYSRHSLDNHFPPFMLQKQTKQNRPNAWAK